MTDDREENELKRELSTGKSSTENDYQEVVTSIESKLSSFWTAASRNFTNTGGFVNGHVDSHNSDEKATAGKNSSIRDSEGQISSKETESVSSGVGQSDLGIDLASITISANKALDELDSKLELVEQKAGKLVNSITSFFSGAVGPNSREESVPNAQRKPFSSILPGDTYGTSRYDMELFTLHTKKALYLRDYLENDAADKFDVSARTQEISQLLTQYSRTLEILMKELVPLSLSYKEFWYIYFRLERELRDSETARKDLLSEGSEKTSNSSGAHHKEEVTKGPALSAENLDASEKISEKLANDESKKAGDEFSWDDDDDDD